MADVFIRVGFEVLTAVVVPLSLLTDGCRGQFPMG
jgi:hypothetical protein